LVELVAHHLIFGKDRDFPGLHLEDSGMLEPGWQAGARATFVCEPSERTFQRFSQVSANEIH